jgi:hypothetical protein
MNDEHCIYPYRSDGEYIHLTDRIRNDIYERFTSSSIFFGELWATDVEATSVPTLLKANDDRLQLSIFAAPLINNINFYSADLNVVNDALGGMGIGSVISYLYPQSLSQSIKEELLKQASEKELEGYVCKANHMDGWYKLKPFKELDVFVYAVQTSYAPNNFGGLKGCSVAVYRDGKFYPLGEVGGGYDAEWRQTVDPKSLIGEVMEVRFDKFAANGKLRFPRFRRWRTDKTKQQCVMNT